MTINFYKQTCLILFLSFALVKAVYGQKDKCASGICNVNDLVVQKMFTLTVSDAYQLGVGEFFGSSGGGVTVSNPNSRTIIIHSAPANAELEVVYTNSKSPVSYTQTIKIPSIIYDTMGLGALVAPFMANSTCEWYLDSVFLPEAKGWTLVPKYTGKYKAKITWPNAATTNTRLEEPAPNTTELTFQVNKIATVSGLTDVETDLSSTIFPNPVSESLSIIEAGNFKYTLIDLNGNIKHSGEGNDKIKIDTQSLTSGVYFLEVKTDKRTTRKKISVK